jgi:hypothetical protein
MKGAERLRKESRQALLNSEQKVGKDDAFDAS